MFYLIQTQHVAVLANKSTTARDILGRLTTCIRKSYLKWMQQGIIAWNKGNIELENGSQRFLPPQHLQVQFVVVHIM